MFDTATKLEIKFLKNKLKSVCCLTAKSCPTLLEPYGLQPARLLCLWDFPGKNTGVGGHFLLQGIFPFQGLNPRLLYWQADSLLLSHSLKPLGEAGTILNSCLTTHPNQRRVRKAAQRVMKINENQRKSSCTPFLKAGNSPEKGLSGEGKRLPSLSLINEVLI